MDSPVTVVSELKTCSNMIDALQNNLSITQILCKMLPPLYIHLCQCVIDDISEYYSPSPSFPISPVVFIALFCTVWWVLGTHTWCHSGTGHNSIIWHQEC